MANSIMSPEVEAVFATAAAPRTKQVNIEDETAEIPSPFPSPEDWRDHWIYFLLLDRFNNPDTPPRHAWDGDIGTFQGGTFEGVRQKLGYLKKLGVGAIWLSPVLKNCQYDAYSYHGYGIQDFLAVDPRFASNPARAEEELQRLIDEIHAHGMYVIFDIVLNHAGNVFEYCFDDGGRSSEAEWRNVPYRVAWRDATGDGRPEWNEPPESPAPDAVVWPDELRRNEFFRRQGRGGEAGGDFCSLKELVTEFTQSDSRQGYHYPVRNTLIRAYQYLIARYDLDGFRIDTLKYIKPEFAQVFGNAMREYALSIGKKNFLTFGEVYDNEEMIARFIGRHTSEASDLIGVDAALDFPLFFRLPSVMKGLARPAEIAALYGHRKEVERGILSSHGEASRYFVTFLDNHDQHNRFYYSPPDDPVRYRDQLTMALGCLFALQGIPCLYYGTEQELHGSGNSDTAVREALWGKTDAFRHDTHACRIVAQLTALRLAQPALRYGRQYFRPISGDGVHFGLSGFPAGVLAFSRILNNQEVVVVANTDVLQEWRGEVLVDYALNFPGARYELLFSNKSSPAGPGTVLDKSREIRIYRADGSLISGPARSIFLQLQNMEVQILRKRS